MAEFWEFLQAIWRHSGQAVTGVLFTVAGLVWAAIAKFIPSVGQWNIRPSMVVALGVLLLFHAAFMSWRDERRARLKADADVHKLKADEYGIEMDCSYISFSWEKHAELPEGVLVILDVNRIVNGNTKDAVIEAKLVAPLWRSSNLIVSTNAKPLLSIPEGIKTKRPPLDRIINLPPKKGIGPGYFLFFFSYEKFKQFIFLPESHRQKSLDEFAELVTESELQIELVDRANQQYIPPIPAPGTLEKRSLRLSHEQQSEERDETA
jgi:hypothetical protein